MEGRGRQRNYRYFTLPEISEAKILTYPADPKFSGFYWSLDLPPPDSFPVPAPAPSHPLPNLPYSSAKLSVSSADSSAEAESDDAPPALPASSPAANDTLLCCTQLTPRIAPTPAPAAGARNTDKGLNRSWGGFCFLLSLFGL